MPLRDVVLLALALFLIVATLLPFVRAGAWWIRVFDFPRGQVAVAGFVVAVLYGVLGDGPQGWEYAVLAALAACVVYQVVRIFPYTRLARRQVAGTPDDEARHGGAAFTLLIANVLMDNRAADRFLDLVRAHDPDLILTVETDGWWAERLRMLDDAYPHTVKVPLDNTYGMLLHSRLELIEPEVAYLVQDDIPSIHTQVRLPGGETFRLHGVHPRPPYPAEDDDTTDRDAELLVVGRAVKAHGGPAVVAGDLNDVAWSHTTHLFQRVSGLLDPRVGRGMYSTFDARNPVLRWPLDHVFHSEHFKLVDLQRLPAWGSDHFPMLVRLRYDPSAPAEQDAPEADGDDHEEAAEKIEKAAEEGSTPTPPPQ